MSKYVLFIQGGGENGYESDTKLVDSLQKSLGNAYLIHYPQLKTDESLADFGWIREIEKAFNACREPVILVAHSLGASMLLKFLSDSKKNKNIKGLFLISTPFWSGDEDWVQGLRLKKDFADYLSKSIPIFFYHCRDDAVIPLSHLELFRSKISWAIFRELNLGGHQFNNDLSAVATDIKLLK